MNRVNGEKQFYFAYLAGYLNLFRHKEIFF